jgi:hypothetical protein
VVTVVAVVLCVRWAVRHGSTSHLTRLAS